MLKPSDRARRLRASRPSRAESITRAVKSVVEPLEGRRLMAATPVLLGDINQTTDQLAPGAAVQLGNVALFSGRATSADGAELFKTDGTKAGTVLLKDINPSGGSAPDLLTKVGGAAGDASLDRVYFSADDGVNGRELWVTDGTAAGTAMVANLYGGAKSANPRMLTAANGHVYFVASDSSGTETLWVAGGQWGTPTRVTITSGTTTGLRVSGVTGITTNYNGVFFTAGGTLYRVANLGSNVAEQMSAPANAQTPVAMGGFVYFTLSSNATGANRGDLYRTDGYSAAGLVKSIDSLTSGTDYANTTMPVASGDRLYFVSGNVTTGAYILWTSDGTAAGTFRVLTSSTLTRTSALVPFATRSVLFANTSVGSGTEPWVSDGTLAGTRQLVDSSSGSNGPATIGFISMPNGRALITTTIENNPTNIWLTDGTFAGTTKIASIYDPATFAYPIGSLNGVALLAGMRTLNDGDLYRSDGTTTGTYRVGANLSGNSDSLLDYPISQTPAFVAAGNAVYFAATEGSSGLELWRSVNNGAPTRVRPAGIGSDRTPNDLTATSDGSLYFTESIGTLQGLYRIASLQTNEPQILISSGVSLDAHYSNLIAVGTTLYFTVGGGNLAAPRLYRYDPSQGNPVTSAVMDGADYLHASAMVKAGDYWYFGAIAKNEDGSYVTGQQRLYRVGLGATAVPEIVANIPSGVSFSADIAQPVVAAGSTLYFTARTDAAGIELWRTDGTAAGTVIVKDLTPDTYGTDFDTYALGSTLGTADGVGYFTAYTGDGVSRAYRTDGTAAGTYAIGDGFVSGNATFAASGGKVYFVGAPVSAPSTSAIYRVDGNVATRVSPVATGDAAFSPYAITVAGGRVFMIGQGGAAARWELWQADSDFGNFEKVAVLGPRTSVDIGGPLRSFFVYGRYAMTATATDLYFPMYTAARGLEPYRLSLAAIPPAPTNVGFDNSSVNEGASQTLFGYALPLATGQSIVSWEWDYDYNGTTFDVDSTGRLPTFVAPDGNATRTIALRVTDNYGQVVTKVQTLTIKNVAPTATLAASGGAGTATATFTSPFDPSAADVAAGFRYYFDFNNDGDFNDAGDVIRSNSPSATGTYASAGTYTIGVFIYDKDGSYTKYLATVTVAAPVATPPVVSFDTFGVFEGATTPFTGHATLASGRTVAKWEWDLDYVGTTFTVDATTASATFDARNLDGPTTRRVALRVTDSAGQVGLAVQTITVNNASPGGAFEAVANADGSATATIRNVTDAPADVAAGFKYSFDFNGDNDFADAGEVLKGTSPTVTFKYATSGTYQLNAQVIDKDGTATYFDQWVTVTVPTPPTTGQLAGTPFGTSGSASGRPIANAFDGNVTTYVDLPTKAGGVMGLDLGSAKVISQIKFAPRAGYGYRLTGGRFEGSNTADFSTGVTTLFTITGSPADGLTTANSLSATPFRYVRYVTPNTSWGNVAEIQFFGSGGTTTPPTNPNPPTTPTGVLAGTPFGTSGSASGRPIANAFDGNVTTYVDLPTKAGGVMGLDLGSAKVVSQIKFAPRAGYGYRLTGGRFEGSNTADFSTGVITLFTITGSPVDGLTTVNSLSSAAFRYVRYVTPASSWGNIAEIQLVGAGGTTTPPPTTPTDPKPPTTPGQITGTAFGTAGSASGRPIANAFDGNASTYVDLPTKAGGVMGLDFGTAKSVSQIKFAARAGYGYRLTGGRFEGSNTADFSTGVTTLFTITGTPGDGLTTVNSLSSVAFRYVRYVAPASSWGNIAEIQFFG